MMLVGILDHQALSSPKDCSVWLELYVLLTLEVSQSNFEKGAHPSSVIPQSDISNFLRVELLTNAFANTSAPSSPTLLLSISMFSSLQPGVPNRVASDFQPFGECLDHDLQ